MKPVVTLRDVSVAYRRQAALQHVSGVFAHASLTAVLGPNGAGKSTFLKAVLGLVPVESGQVEIHMARKLIAYLPQQAEIDRSFPISVLDCVCLGFWQRLGSLGGLNSAMREAAQDALRAVGLQGFEQRPLGSLSAGQLQRVLFARILVQDADVILLDEPFNAVDARTTEDLLALIHGWHAQQRTVVAVLHDHEQVRRHFPQAVLLARQLVAWGETAEVLAAANLQRARQMPDASNASEGGRWPELAA
ncbi:MAG: metal ABC transporter ATP-binding protein [Collimonas pratensis]|uniref:metal ABC transporter ATP-binding protein n=1 Tax=Collimonas pratensis TaxID=279113 RepID=UPI003C78FDF3